MRIAYNSNVTIFEDIFLNKDVRYYYNTFHGDVLERAKMGYEKSLRRFIDLQSRLAEWFDTIGTYLQVVRRAESGLRYLAKDHNLLIITKGNKDFVEYNLRANSLDNLIDKVISTDDKDTVCGANYIDMYISHNKEDLNEIDGHVRYFVLVGSREGNELKFTGKRMPVFYVSDLSEDCLKWVIEQIEENPELKEDYASVLFEEVEAKEQLDDESNAEVEGEEVIDGESEGVEGEACAETCEAASE